MILLRAYPEPKVQTLTKAGNENAPPARMAQPAKAKEGDNNGADNAVLEQKLVEWKLEDEEIDESKRLIRK